MNLLETSLRVPLIIKPAAAAAAPRAAEEAARALLLADRGGVVVVVADFADGLSGDTGTGVATGSAGSATKDDDGGCGCGCNASTECPSDDGKAVLIDDVKMTTDLFTHSTSQPFYFFQVLFRGIIVICFLVGNETPKREFSRFHVK